MEETGGGSLCSKPPKCPPGGGAAPLQATPQPGPPLLLNLLTDLDGWEFNPSDLDMD